MKRTLAVGLIGYDFMGRTHSNAWRQAPRFFDLPAEVRMKAICGRNPSAVKKAAAKLGWEKFATDWREVVADARIGITRSIDLPWRFTLRESAFLSRPWVDCSRAEATLGVR